MLINKIRDLPGCNLSNSGEGGGGGILCCVFVFAFMDVWDSCVISDGPMNLEITAPALSAHLFSRWSNTRLLSASSAAEEVQGMTHGLFRGRQVRSRLTEIMGVN